MRNATFSDILAAVDDLWERYQDDPDIAQRIMSARADLHDAKTRCEATSQGTLAQTIGSARRFCELVGPARASEVLYALADTIATEAFQ